MARIAVDVVLLPDEEMTERVIEANAELVAGHGAAIVLGRHDRLPHISLAMGCLEPASMASVGDVLAGIAGETPVGSLEITGVRTSRNARGELVSAFEIDNSTDLQALHEAVMVRLDPFLSADVTAGMVCDELVAETTLAWVRDYRTQAAFERFWPHITVGYGRYQPAWSFPVTFRASDLAVCHLGNHCTCRRVLSRHGL